VKLTDFGLAKHLNSDLHTSTFCGTSEYLAPEVVIGRSYGIEVDWWALGILLYEMAYGKTPFFCESKAKLFKRIAQADVPFPTEIDSSIQSLIVGLLEKDPTKRFTFNQLKAHPFFSGLDFDDVLCKKVTPSFVPPLPNSDFADCDGSASLDSLDCPVCGSIEAVKDFSFDVGATHGYGLP
jgi:serine/threonine protein kinase